MEFDQTHKEQLKDILEEAGERVSDSLSMMIGQPVDTDIIDFHKDSVEFQSKNSDREIDVIVYSELEEGENGFALFTMDDNSARKLANLLLMRDEDHEIEDFTEDEIDALTESGNIVIGNFLSQVADHFNTEIMFDTPRVMHGDDDCGYDEFIGEDRSSEHSLIADIRLIAEDVGIDGRYILIPSNTLTSFFIDFFED